MAVRVQLWDFDQGAEIDALSKGNGDVGAVVSFTGLVRDHYEGAPIDGLELEHYPGMTEAALAEIEADARARWPLAGVTIIHRYGPLRPSDRIVLVVCASRHRQAAFEAASFIMDFLKTRAPFWKKEMTADGGHWVEARESDEVARLRWMQP